MRDDEQCHTPVLLSCASARTVLERERSRGTESERRKVAMRVMRKRVVKSGAGEVDRYADAFVRVRLVRAWIAAAAAMLTMLFGYVALLERVLR